MNLQLFRGDNYLNTATIPGIYKGNGLTSKAFFGAGDPAYIDKIGLLETMRMHIKPSGKVETSVYDATAYLSFTEDKNKALEWASGKLPGLIKVPDDYMETRYVFTFDMPDIDILPVAENIYEYRFACNRLLKRSNVPDPLGITSYALQYNVCPLCNNTNKVHSIFLVDTVSFLKQHIHLARYEGAYNNACRDKEWLVLPNDPLVQFRSSRIQRADFWTATHYRLSTEQPRDPQYFSKLGIL